jgi:hypothetical protein
LADWVLTSLSVVFGGAITLVVSLTFHWFANKEFRRVRDDISCMSEGLETETKRLQKAT